MIEESKYCSNIMEKYFNKNLVMTSEEDEDFKNSTTCSICHNDYVDNNGKVRDHCRITGKCRGLTHRDCKIKFTLN